MFVKTKVWLNIGLRT